MAQRLTVEAQRAGLARRLRPLYAGLRNDEFERMVSRIAEIECYGPISQPNDIGPRVARVTPRVAGGRVVS